MEPLSPLSPLTALSGGVMIGLAASIFVLLLGRIAGVSGLLANTIRLSTGAPWAVAAAFILGLPLGAAAAAWLIITVLRYWLMRESFNRKAFAIRDKDVLYRTGFIIRTLHVCPFNRIQHCSVHAGPIERQFGLASISLFTSGSEGSDLRIPGLTEGTAANIREYITKKIRIDEQPAN